MWLLWMLKMFAGGKRLWMYNIYQCNSYIINYEQTKSNSQSCSIPTSVMLLRLETQRYGQNLLVCAELTNKNRQIDATITAWHTGATSKISRKFPYWEQTSNHFVSFYLMMIWCVEHRKTNPINHWRFNTNTRYITCTNLCCACIK